MNDSRFGEDEVFDKARRLSGAELDDFLDVACAGDSDLRVRIRKLLAANSEADQFFSEDGLSQSFLSLSLADTVGDNVGKYKLTAKLGEGGCGVVYLAEQSQPLRRLVALKIIKLGMDTEKVVARFEAERQALAAMDHPSIAKVFDAGATETGRPYFVMELVRGSKITDYCNDNRLSVTDRLHLFVKVCDAVQHAHNKGIIHRDLKPSNILVASDQGASLPKVIDFGIAKAIDTRLTEHTVLTTYNQLLGTPAYMSPEQMLMGGRDVDTRTDIYSLGVLLYELLTGQPPSQHNQVALLRFEDLREVDPPRPSTRLLELPTGEADLIAKQRHTELTKLIREIRGDLDWIVMKCLEKDRARRYVTANSLSSDVKRFLTNETVSARAPSQVDRARKMLRRNKVVALSCLILLIVLTAASIVSTREAVRARNAEQDQKKLRGIAETAQEKQSVLEKIAERKAEDARVNLYAADMFVAQTAYENHNLGLARAALEAHWPTKGEPDLRGFEWRYLWKLCEGQKKIVAHTGRFIRCMCLAPSGGILASGDDDGTVSFWDAASLTLISQLKMVGSGAKTRGQEPGTPILSSLAFSPEGRFLAVGSNQGFELWDLEQTNRVFSLGAPWADVSFSPHEPVIAVASCASPFNGDGRVQLIKYPDFQLIRDFPNTGGRAAYTADGNHLFIAGQRKLLFVDLISGSQKEIVVPGGVLAGGNIFKIFPSADGELVATVSPWDPFARLWNQDTGALVTELKGHDLMVWSVSFAKNLKIAATTSSDQTVRLWDLETHKVKRYLLGHTSEVWASAFSEGSAFLFSGGKDGSIIGWDLKDPKEFAIGHLRRSSFPPVVSPKSRFIAVAVAEGGVKIYDLSNNSEWKSVPFGLCPIAWDPEGQTAVILTTNQTLVQCGLDSDRQRAQEPVSLEDPVVCSYTSQFDREVFTTVTRSGHCIVWNGATISRLAELRTDIAFDNSDGGVALSPDRKILAVWHSCDLEFWDLATGAKFKVIERNKVDLGSVQFSPDGRFLVTTGGDGIAFWDINTASVSAKLIGHKGGIRKMAFSPDGRTLASVGDGVIKLWNVATFRQVAENSDASKRGEDVLEIAFSPDGNTLLYVGYDVTGTLYQLRAPTLDEIRTLSGRP